MSETANENERTGGGDMSSLLTSLLSDPQVLSKVGDTLAALTQNAKSTSSTENADITDATASIGADNAEDNTKDTANAEKETDASQTEAASNLPTLLSKLAESGGKPSPELKREIDLLRAVRPYLSPRRREMIDGFIQMSKLGEIFKSLSDGGKNVLQ